MAASWSVGAAAEVRRASMMMSEASPPTASAAAGFPSAIMPRALQPAAWMVVFSALSRRETNIAVAPPICAISSAFPALRKPMFPRAAHPYRCTTSLSLNSTMAETTAEMPPSLPMISLLLDGPSSCDARAPSA